uniref:Mitochondrial import inner membrane translocase subunit TIM23 n=2 Tax=Odontella aurita TaxID=265563 RepID=A0A7S4INQ6_9STRA|mmetsp:Transcript_27962/g.82220  ORF Transcript_27962/g.82220 Transcript_27962/m.82220 type:complete len:209 (+) Transcript_27962:124-750(+)
MTDTGKYDHSDVTSDSSSSAGALPNFDASAIKLTTIAPALGVPNAAYGEPQPDYLDYDQKGRGVVVTMFANAGMSYLLGILGGGLYGLKEGLAHTPSTRLKVKVNSVLNHCGRHGSRAGNVLGVLSIVYSLYEWQAETWELDSYTERVTTVPASSAFAAMATGMTYYSRAGPRVAGLAGAIGLGAVGVTYGAYSALGIPYGHKGYLFF